MAKPGIKNIQPGMIGKISPATPMATSAKAAMMRSRFTKM